MVSCGGRASADDRWSGSCCCRVPAHAHLLAFLSSPPRGQGGNPLAASTKASAFPPRSGCEGVLGLQAPGFGTGDGVVTRHYHQCPLKGSPGPRQNLRLCVSVDPRKVASWPSGAIIQYDGVLTGSLERHPARPAAGRVSVLGRGSESHGRPAPAGSGEKLVDGLDPILQQRAGARPPAARLPSRRLFVNPM